MGMLIEEGYYEIIFTIWMSSFVPQDDKKKSTKNWQFIIVEMYKLFLLINFFTYYLLFLINLRHAFFILISKKQTQKEPKNKR